MQARPHTPQSFTLFIRSKPSSRTPLQSLSWLSQISTPPLVIWHSQPSGSSLSRFTKPGLHASRRQRPMEQTAVALAKSQVLPQVPQFFGSVLRLKSSSTRPLQLSSRPLHSSGRGEHPSGPSGEGG